MLSTFKRITSECSVLVICVDHGSAFCANCTTTATIHRTMPLAHGWDRQVHKQPPSNSTGASQNSCKGATRCKHQCHIISKVHGTMPPRDVQSIVSSKWT
eukprot:2394325-Amphidinium_carterae.1